MRGLIVLSMLVLTIACGPLVGSGESATTVGQTDTDTDDTTAGPTTTPATTTTTTTGDTDTTTTVGPSDTGCGDDAVCLDLPPVACPEHPDFACSAPVPCEPPADCGGTFSPFDENGCLRPTCADDADCPGTDLCFVPQDWGGCASSGLFCEDDPSGACVCGGDADCGGSYCLPPELVPPADCGGFDDEQTCVAAGCSGWVLGRPIIPSGNACLCDLDEGYCLWSPAGLDGIVDNTPYVRLSDARVVVFETRFDVDPIGWTPCDALAFPPGECECAQFICD